MELDSLFPSRYLKGMDLQGRSVTLRIERVGLEKFYDQQSRAEVEKLVIYFVGKQKAVIAGKSLSYEIANICGSKNTDDWINKEIILYTERKLIFGRELDVFRARVKVAENSAETGF